MTLTELAIKRPTLIIILFTAISVLGIYGYSQLQYDLMPKMTAPVIVITTIYPGGSPNEVETSVTKVIEDATTGLEKISDIRSTSTEGRSMVVVEFDQSVNIDLALQDAQRRVNQVINSLPQDAKTPIISKIAFDEIPVLKMAVNSTMKDKEFYQYVKDKIQPRISKIEGVGSVSIVGGVEREIKVAIDLQKLRSYGLSLFAVTQAIKSANIDFPTGKIQETQDQFVVRVAAKFRTVQDLSNMVVARSKQGGEIKLSDIADVRDDIKEITTINRLNGIPSIGLTIQKQSDGNAVDVSKKVRKELQAMEKDYADIGLKFDIANDASTFTMDSANAVKEDLLMAILLVALVMMVFLHSMRNSIIVMVAIPSSLIATFLAMYIFGFTLNIMTLLAMSLVIGILVDDSIVVLENIHRHLEMGKDQRTAALHGRNEIGFAALSITMVDIVVFLPMSFITGIIGDFLREYALVVVFSTSMSLLVSFTITPMLASRFSRIEDTSRKTIFNRFSVMFERFFSKITSYYTRLLKWSLAHWSHGFTVVATAILLLVSSIYLFPAKFIGVEFMPNVDRDELILTIEAEPGSTVLNTNRLSVDIEKILWTFPEVERVLTSVGTSSEGSGLVASNYNNTCEYTISLLDKSKRKESTDLIGQRIKQKVLEIPGVKARVSTVGLMGSQNMTPIQILVTGTTFEDVYEGARIISDVTKSIQGTSDVRLSTDEGKPEIQVNIDRNKIAALGLSIMDVGQNLRIALTGDDESKFREGITEYDIRIMLDQFDRSKTDNVSKLTFINNKGQPIELQQFADVAISTGPTKLERQDRIRAINIYSQVLGSTSGVVSQIIDAKMKSIKLPPGVSYQYTGQQKYMMESFISLFVALGAGILFVYMIMVALYDSFVYPFVVLFSIPVAIIGALYGLALTNKSMSIYSMLGIIMLVGLVAKNAILLVDRTNQMKKEQGLSTFDALIEAAQTRLRPILMTTFAMVMGMSPIALSTSAGSEAKSGLAVVLIGGLLSSMFLTLLLVPVVYQSMDKLRIWIPKVFKRLLGIKEKAEELSVNTES